MLFSGPQGGAQPAHLHVALCRTHGSKATEPGLKFRIFGSKSSAFYAELGL